MFLGTVQVTLSYNVIYSLDKSSTFHYKFPKALFTYKRLHSSRECFEENHFTCLHFIYIKIRVILFSNHILLCINVII